MRTVYLLFLAGLFGFATLSHAAESPLEIPAIKGVKIDGALTEWQSLPPTGDWNQPNKIAWGQSNYTNPADPSGQAWLAWDPQYLYIAADVIDDHHVQTETGENIYRGDHVMVLLQPGRASAAAGQNYFQIGLSPGALSDSGDFLSRRPPEACVWQPQYVQGSGILVAAQKTDKGYTLEAAIPWELLKIHPQSGQRLGFDLCASDADTSPPSSKPSPASNPANGRSTPRAF